ncbi:hypothetical protein ACFQ2B_34640 [Streptomyces stramineus]
MATTVIAPVVVAAAAAAIGLAITGGFSWVTGEVKGEEPPLYVSGSRAPRTVESPAAAPSVNPPAAGEARAGSSPAPTGSHTPADQEGARSEGVNVGRHMYQCPWNVWVVKTPPGELVNPPVKGREVDSSLVSSRNAGDPDKTLLTLTLQPQGSRPLVVKEIRIRVVKRHPVPPPGQATVLGLLTAGCGGGLATVRAHADLDGGGQYARVVTTGGTASIPWEITGGRTLEVDLTVSTRGCDCSWVPEIVWAKDGEVHTTQWLDDGLPFRTIPSAGYRRTAWKLHYADDPGDPGFSQDTWLPVPFDTQLLN